MATLMTRMDVKGSHLAAPIGLPFVYRDRLGLLYQALPTLSQRAHEAGLDVVAAQLRQASAFNMGPLTALRGLVEPARGAGQDRLARCASFLLDQHLVEDLPAADRLWAGIPLGEGLEPLGLTRDREAVTPRGRRAWVLPDAPVSQEFGPLRIWVGPLKPTAMDPLEEKTLTMIFVQDLPQNGPILWTRTCPITEIPAAIHEVRAMTREISPWDALRATV